jgi:hypothetical protein
MSLNLTGFAGLAAARKGEAAPANTNAGTTGGKREEAKIWLNFGYPKIIKGEPDTETFVSLARGIPLDQIEKFDMSKQTRSSMATLRRDQNRFLDMLMAEADKLEPGTSVVLCFDEHTNLGIEMRRRGEGAAPIEEEADAPLPFSFRSAD